LRKTSSTEGSSPNRCRECKRGSAITILAFESGEFWELKPIVAAAGPVARVLALRDDALKTELAGVLKHGGAVALGAVDPFIELYPRAKWGEYAHQIGRTARSEWRERTARPDGKMNKGGLRRLTPAATFLRSRPWRPRARLRSRTSAIGPCGSRRRGSRTTARLPARWRPA
jgi:hypothetical protein